MKREMFEEGNVLVITEKVTDRGYWTVGEIVTVGKYGNLVPDRKREGYSPTKSNYKFRFLARQTKNRTERGNNMSDTINKTVAEVFENTKDAILVQRHLGTSIGENFIAKLNVEDHKEEILAEAKRIQAEQDKQANLRYVIEEPE